MIRGFSRTYLLRILRVFCFALLSCALLHSIAWGAKQTVVPHLGVFFLKRDVDDKNLACVACKKIAQPNDPPTRCSGCLNFLCKGCYDSQRQVFTHNKIEKCPNCKTPTTDFGFDEEVIEMFPLKEEEWKGILGTLEIQCKNKQCEWRMHFNPDGDPEEDYKQHAQKCEYAPQQCRFCSKKLIRKDIRNHEANSCPKRQVTCSNCESTVVHEEMKDHKDKYCQVMQLGLIGRTSFNEQQIQELIDKTKSLFLAKTKEIDQLKLILKEKEKRIEEFEAATNRNVRLALKSDGEVKSMFKQVKDDFAWSLYRGGDAHEQILDLDAKSWQDTLVKSGSFSAASNPFVLNAGWEVEQRNYQVVLVLEKNMTSKESDDEPDTYDAHIMVAYTSDDNAGEGVLPIDWSYHEPILVNVLHAHEDKNNLKLLLKSEDAIHNEPPSGSAGDEGFDPHFNMPIAQGLPNKVLAGFVHNPSDQPIFKLKVSLPDTLQGNNTYLRHQGGFLMNMAHQVMPLSVVRGHQLRLALPAPLVMGQFVDNHYYEQYGENSPLLFKVNNEETWQVSLEKTGDGQILVFRLKSIPPDPENYIPVLKTVHGSLFSSAALNDLLPGGFRVQEGREGFHQATGGGYGLPIDASEDIIKKHTTNGVVYFDLILNMNEPIKPPVQVVSDIDPASLVSINPSMYMHVRAAHREQEETQRQLAILQKTTDDNTAGRLEREFSGKTMGSVRADGSSALEISWTVPELTVKAKYQIKSPEFTVGGGRYYLSLVPDGERLTMRLHAVIKKMVARVPRLRPWDKIQARHYMDKGYRYADISLVSPEGRRGSLARNERWRQIRSKQGMFLKNLEADAFQKNAGFKAKLVFTPKPAEINESTPLLNQPNN